MPQEKKTIPSVLEVIRNVKKEKILPLYYLFGEDSFALISSLKAIENAVNPLISNDFDKEIYYSEEKNIKEIINAAQTFPFGSQKKLIIYKEAEKAQDKKLLDGYVSSLSEFTVLVLVHNGKITNFSSPPFKLLLENNFLFEAKELKGKHLAEWTIEWVNSKGKHISLDNAMFLTEISGENRLIIESQVEKILAYLADKPEVTFEVINKVAASSLQFTIFDLQDAIFQKNKEKLLKIAFNMIDNGENASLIISMLTKAFIGLSQIAEFKDKSITDNEIAKTLAIPFFTVKNFKAASMLFSTNDLAQAAEALLKADVAIKTTSTDHKTVLALLIAELF